MNIPRLFVAILSAALTLSPATAPAQPAVETSFTFTAGPLALTFAADTGNLLRIACDNRTIARGDGSIPSTTFALGPAADQVTWFEKMNLARKLRAKASPDANTLELTIAIGDNAFELIERYRLHPDQRRIDRSLRILHHQSQALKLRGVAFRTPGITAPPDGFYRLPMTWPPRNRPFADLQPGRMAGGRGSIAPAILDLGPKAATSLLFASFADDPPMVHVFEGTGQVEVRQILNAAGHFKPDQPQHAGFVSMQIVTGDYWQALPKFWDWMDDVKLRIPADQPAWIRSAVLYSFHPGGLIGSRFLDLGGFEPATRRLLPTLPALGVDSIWIMPVEFRSVYWPFDYYRFQDGLGTPEQYRALVAKAHELKLHVLQDLVPHGGSPEAVHNKAHPEFMLRREDGSTLKYWLNDFALPAWQKYIADVTAHYIKQYDIDGYRVDACYGSKEMNWNPDVPYARASLSLMSGGLGMLNTIRKTVRSGKPDRGAILAETESARHSAVADAVYDFGFCYNLLPQWRKTDAPDFVKFLQEYLEEQKYTEPRGTIRLRHVESHDSLRSTLSYGVEGMHAMYALSAWIDGIPLIYHGQEWGHEAALAKINAVRKQFPELADGQAHFRAVQCSAPGVFTCLRTRGNRASAVAINFNRHPVDAQLTWPGHTASLHLRPMEYTVVGADNPRAQANPERAAEARPIDLPDALPCPDATEWFVDTIEGRLHGLVPPARTDAPPTATIGSIYWRPQDASQLWRELLQPLYPAKKRLGWRTTPAAATGAASNAPWHILEIDPKSAPSDLRFITWHDNKSGLWLAGGKGLPARLFNAPHLPPAPDVTVGSEIVPGVRLRCVGPQYIVSNAHFEVRLNRQGGVIAHLQRDGRPIVEQHDLYGDQEYFANTHGPRIDAGTDVECAIRVAVDPAGKLLLQFEGQLRGSQRFALMRPPLWFRNHYTFDNTAQFQHAWAFRTEKPFKDRKAFLAFHVAKIDARQFEAKLGDQRFSQVLGTTQTRQFATGNPAPGLPDSILFQPQSAGAPWGLSKLTGPATAKAFVAGGKLFITLLDGPTSSMDAGKWHEFSATWQLK